MWKWFQALDRVLRGEATRLESLRRGSVEIPLFGLIVVIVLLAAVYGACLAFFAVCTTSYPFMSLMNVVICAAAGMLGLAFLLQTLHRLTLAQRGMVPPAVRTARSVEPQESAEEEPEDEQAGGESAEAADNADAQPDDEVVVKVVDEPADDVGALDRLEGQLLSRHVKTVFGIWIVLFGLVGAQMGWLLRPFLGDPSLPFAWFRERESNFFEALYNILRSLFA